VTFAVILWGGSYALFFAPQEHLPLALAEGRYHVTFASSKVVNKKVTLVRLVRAGDRTPRALDLEAAPPLSDADFGLAEAVEWVYIDSGETAIAAGSAKGRAEIVLEGGFATTWWPTAAGMLVLAVSRGDGPDSIAAALAMGEDRFADSGQTLAIGAEGELALYDPKARESAVTARLAPGVYRVASAAKFETRAAELSAVVRLTRST
jgi:hypothetical protein